MGSLRNKNRGQDFGRKAQGFTLIEFLVASALAMIVLLAIGVTYATTGQTKRGTEHRLAVQQDLRNTSEMITRDARMAGSFGCFNMGNLLDKNLPRFTNRGVTLALSSGAGWTLEESAGLTVWSAAEADAQFGASGFAVAPGNAVVFTYGLNPQSLGTGNTLPPGPVRDWAAAGGASAGHVAVSSCLNMQILPGNNVASGTISGLVDPFNAAQNLKSVFYVPQTTVSQVHSVAYVVGRISAVDAANSLYRFTLNAQGGWDGPQLMVANIDQMQVARIYSGCDNASTDASYSEDRAGLVTGGAARISALPTILELRLKVGDNTRTHGVVNQYLIRANVRGGNVCANL